jgi:hypothetical protein
LAALLSSPTFIWAKGLFNLVIEPVVKLPLDAHPAKVNATKQIDAVVNTFLNVVLEISEYSILCSNEPTVLVKTTPVVFLSLSIIC